MPRKSALNNECVEFCSWLLNDIEEVTKTAVLIAIKDDEYKGVFYDDKKIDNIYVLLGAVETENSIIPVKLEIKEFTNIENKLYVYVDVNEIKKDEARHSQTSKEISPRERRSTSSIYRITDILPFVNNGALLKYFPDSMLSNEQIGYKQDALKEQQRHIEEKIKARANRKSKKAIENSTDVSESLAETPNTEVEVDKSENVDSTIDTEPISVKDTILPDLAMDSLSVENTRRTGERLDIDNVVSNKDRATRNLRKRSLKEANEFFQTQLTDEGYVIDKATRGTDDRMVYELYHDVKGAGSKVYA